MSKYFGKCFGPSTPAPKSSFWLICPSFSLLKLALELKLVQFSLWYGSGYLESASQVQFSGSCSQVSGSQSLNFKVPGTYFQVSGCQGPTVLAFRVPESRFSGSQISESQGSASQGPGVSGLKSQGTRSPVSCPDFRVCHLFTIITK